MAQQTDGSVACVHLTRVRVNSTLAVTTFLFVCLFDCLFDCLFVWLFVCVFVCLFVYLVDKQNVNLYWYYILLDRAPYIHYIALAIDPFLGPPEAHPWGPPRPTRPGSPGPGPIRGPWIVLGPGVRSDPRIRSGQETRLGRLWIYIYIYIYMYIIWYIYVYIHCTNICLYI